MYNLFANGPLSEEPILSSKSVHTFVDNLFYLFGGKLLEDIVDIKSSLSAIELGEIAIMATESDLEAVVAQVNTALSGISTNLTAFGTSLTAEVQAANDAIARIQTQSNPAPAIAALQTSLSNISALSAQLTTEATAVTTAQTAFASIAPAPTPTPPASGGTTP